MNIPFVKMQAQGNDFVILDAIHDTLPELTQAFITNICDRHRGIGCDQLLVLQASDRADALMLIYNADGSQAANCGNGLRCVGELLMQQTNKSQVSIALADRVVSAERTPDGVQVMMGSAVVEEVTEDYIDVSIGNPHRVYFKQPQACPERNVEIISDYDENHASIRIIECGAGETLACGSGACATAVAVAYRLNKPLDGFRVIMRGGEVMVSLRQDKLYLSGKVSIVYTGKYRLSSEAELHLKGH